ncbi:hypothetical protein L0222_17740 [bacterium]|nr:hypothetical protein [bacterium]
MSTRIGGSAAQPPTIEMPVAVDSNSMNQPRAMEQPKTAEPEAKSISAQQKNSQLAEHSMAGRMMSVQLQSKATAKANEPDLSNMSVVPMA